MLTQKIIYYIMKKGRTILNSLVKEVKNMRKNQFVGPHPGGGWQVKGAGNQKPTVVTTTQKQAIDRGRQIAINQQSELLIQGTNGQIRGRNSYGNDPCPPKG
jgi:hypothetical protein